ncbi:MAG: G1 family endopeptidase [Thermoplasmata archaeon]|nr:G1 family endopeptidase [Thermoplasmata archaeon]
MMGTASRTALVALVVLFAVPWMAAGALSVAAVPAQHSAALPTLFHTNSTSSTNWAGYAVSASTGSVSMANASWVEPTISKCPTKTEYAAFWVGIDGYTSASVEQTGTDSDCSHGKAVYYAWYEFYPSPSHRISSLTISPGDVIFASVNYDSTTVKFTTVLTDTTTGKTFSTSAAVKTAARSSAEWIAEAPSSFSGVLPLAPFGTVGFGFDHTSLASTGSATIGTTTALMGTFAGLVSLTMINHTGKIVKASTSAVSTDNTSFTVTWKNAGP